MKSARLFDEAIKAVKAIDDRYERFKALSSIAQALAQAGKIDKAARLFDEAIKAVKAIDDRYEI